MGMLDPLTVAVCLVRNTCIMSIKDEKIAQTSTDMKNTCSWQLAYIPQKS